jgi:hypothetical protein
MMKKTSKVAKTAVNFLIAVGITVSITTIALIIGKESGPPKE